MVFYWSLSDSMSPQVSGTLLSILADLNNAVVWMVSTLTSKSSSSFINPLVTVPRAPIKIDINVTLLFHSFFNSLARYDYDYYYALVAIVVCSISSIEHATATTVGIVVVVVVVVVIYAIKRMRNIFLFYGPLL